ncbi:MAG: hypothetical protein IJT12_02295 [Paludibacteraceae bacterium]|nr:hypothetical protein [Paludibacteraceae bacterium]
MKKLDVMATIKDGFAIALVNYVSLILTAVLYVLTVWIPYLNVGTTIAMASLPAEMAKGNVVNPLFIFDGKYRKNMGEFFILMALMGGAILIGFFFGIIPGLVLSIAWSFAAVLFVDKDMNALEALRESNRLTYGNKWRIFGATILVGIALGIITGIISALFNIGHVSWLMTIGTIINMIIDLCAAPAMLGIEASIYKQLTSGEIIEAAPAAPAAAPAPEAPKAEPEAPKAEKNAEKKAEK